MFLSWSFTVSSFLILTLQALYAVFAGTVWLTTTVIFKLVTTAILIITVILIILILSCGGVSWGIGRLNTNDFISQDGSTAGDQITLLSFSYLIVSHHITILYCHIIIIISYHIIIPQIMLSSFHILSHYTMLSSCIDISSS